MATWLAIRKPVTGLRGLLLKILSFLIPLGVWCAVSYCPFIWHPMTRIVDVGDAEGMVVGDDWKTPVFEEENRKLKEAGRRPAVGVLVNPKVLPAPHEVGRALYTAFSTTPRKTDTWFHEGILLSLKTIFIGFSLAMALAIPLGLLCGTFDGFAKLTEPVVDFVRYMPPPTFGALMIGVFGLFDAPKVAIIFIGCFFTMVLVTANTARSLDGALIEAAQTLGARRLSIITHVIVPGSIPGIYKDMRIMLGAAWTFLTAAELVGAMSGLSAFINQQGKYQRYDNVYAGIIVIGAIGFFTDRILAFLGTILFPWTPEANHKVRHWFRWLTYFARREQERVHIPRHTRPDNRAVPAASADGELVSVPAKELTHAGS